MKVQVTKNQARHIENYVNVDSLEKLHEAVSPGEADEVIVDNVLRCHTELKEYAAKLCYGGTIIVKGYDAELLAEEFTCGRITLEQFNSFIDGRKLYTLQRIAALLEELQFKIVKRRYHHNQFIVTAERNHEV